MITGSAYEITVRACTELGIAPPIIANDTTSQLGFQSGALINSLGESLIRMHDWQFLMETATFVADGVSTLYPLPSDFGRIVNQTMWSTGNRMPVVGPQTSQQWGWNQFGIVADGTFFRYRVLRNELEIFPTPGAGETFNFYYISKNWVDQFGSGAVFQDSVTDSNDTPLFDFALMVKGLKVKLWGQKGFDTTELAAEYDSYLKMEMAQNQGAAILRLSGQYDDFLLNGRRNIPDGNW